MIVGISMFLLPPVPGVPVYIASGVILVNAAWDKGEGMNFWAACVFGIAIGIILKLCAVTLQQKGFGEGMRGSVRVRQICGVNSTSIRAIKVILEKPGLSPQKVSILVGGPDWPTSVLTGILGLKLFEMLLGTLPCAFLVTPCVLAGAFMLRSNEGGPWESAGTMMLAVSAMTQTLSLLSAMYFIEKVASARRAELEAMELDEAVAASRQPSPRKHAPPLCVC